MSSNQFTSEERFLQPVAESQRPYSAGAAYGSDSMHKRGDSILVGESVAVRRLRSQIQRIAPYFRTALIRGESGSGKEQVARAIHALSPVGHGPFIVAHAVTVAESAGSGEAGST